MKNNSTSSGPKLLLTAGAQAAAQGLVRTALLTKLLPIGAAVAFTLRLFRRKSSTEIRPAAGNVAPNSRDTSPRPSYHGPATALQSSGEPAESQRRASREPAESQPRASRYPARKTCRTGLAAARLAAGLKGGC